MVCSSADVGVVGRVGQEGGVDRDARPAEERQVRRRGLERAPGDPIIGFVGVGHGLDSRATSEFVDATRRQLIGQFCLPERAVDMGSVREETSRPFSRSAWLPQLAGDCLDSLLDKALTGHLTGVARDAKVRKERPIHE